MSSGGWALKMRSATACSLDTMLLASFVQMIKHIILSRLYQLCGTAHKFVKRVGFVGSMVSLREPGSDITQTAACLHRVSSLPVV